MVIRLAKFFISLLVSACSIWDNNENTRVLLLGVSLKTRVAIGYYRVVIYCFAAFSN